MTLSNLGPWLIETPGFNSRLEAVIADSVCGEFSDNFVRRSGWDNDKHDWGYLVLAASVLAGSEEGSCQSAALRIAQACLSSPYTSAEHHDAAALVLDALANHPALTLAIKRKLLKSNVETRLPLPAKIEWFRRSILQSVVLSNEDVLRVNHFQRKFWEYVDVHEWVSVSAPTSAGKSYIISHWVSEYLHTHKRSTIIYVVPTRALINQVESDLKAFLRDEHLDSVTVSSLPIARTLVHPGAKVFVFTQERLHILLTSVGVLHVDVLIIDEAHKVGDRQRGVLLQQVIETVATTNIHCKVIFASPMTSNPEVLLADANKKISTSSFTSDDTTVNQNLIWICQIRGQPKIWEVALCLPKQKISLGFLRLPAIPASDSKRLSFVAFAVAQYQPGNIIYVNGAAEAEKIASQLYDLLGQKAEIRESSLNDLIELAKHVVHKDCFSLWKPSITNSC